jgi:hypothetical protein
MARLRGSEGLRDQVARGSQGSCEAQELFGEVLLHRLGKPAEDAGDVAGAVAGHGVDELVQARAVLQGEGEKDGAVSEDRLDVGADLRRGDEDLADTAVGIEAGGDGIGVVADEEADGGGRPALGRGSRVVIRRRSGSAVPW